MLTSIELIHATVDGMAERGFGHTININITSGPVKASIDILGLSNDVHSGLKGFVAGAARRKIAGQSVIINSLMPSADFCAVGMRITSPAKTCWPMVVLTRVLFKRQLNN
ncbi:MAG: hypothetical protein ACI80S_000413 [Pseudohongiellaceae bacterium]|jgi:hypothetical protein